MFVDTGYDDVPEGVLYSTNFSCPGGEYSLDTCTANETQSCPYGPLGLICYTPGPQPSSTVVVTPMPVTSSQVPTPTPTETPECMGSYSDMNSGWSAFWTVRGDMIDFEMSASTTGYVAIAFSEDRIMPNSDVVVGAVASDNSSFFVSDRSIGSARVAPTVDSIQDLTYSEAAFIDGRTVISFSRPRVPSESFPTDIALDHAVYLLWAMGPVNLTQQTISQHSMRGRSSQTIEFPSAEYCPSIEEMCEQGDIRLVDQFAYQTFDNFTNYILVVNASSVEICINGTYLPVCRNSSVDSAIWATVCTQFGYDGLYTTSNNSGMYSPVITDVTCPNDTFVEDCYIQTANSCAYSPYEFIEIHCFAAIENVDNGTCVDGALTLYGNSTQSEGMVYSITGIPLVCIGGQYVAICNDSRSDPDSAYAICTELGYYGGGMFVDTGYDDVPEGVLYSTNFSCPGGEYSLDTCTANETQSCPYGPLGLICYTPVPQPSSTVVVTPMPVTSSQVPTPTPTGTPECMGSYFDMNSGWSAFWTVRGDMIDFEMSASTTGYVAIAFSEDRLMPNSDVVVGAVASDNSSFFVSDRSIGSARVAPTVDSIQDLTYSEAAFIDGRTVISFSRPRVPSESFPTDIALDHAVYLLWAMGPVNLTQQTISQHSMRGRSSQTIEFPSAEYCPSIAPCDLAICYNGGTCMPMDDGYFCECSVGYTGVNCTENINDCDPNPCMNGATCIDELNGYNCTCAVGYAGANCSVNINDCASSPCKQGNCTDGINAFICDCFPGYTGFFCDMNIDDCNPDPCKNGGTCRDGNSSYSCMCVAGYTGQNCTENVNDCMPNPCENNGTCFDQVNGYRCECITGFTGENCSMNIDDCASKPCNQGNCTDEVNSFFCTCFTGYTGDVCDENIDDCATNVCENGGTCIDGIDSFTCNCSLGFTGQICDIDIDDCDPNPCLYGGTCMDRINGFSCNCPEGLTGDTCDICINVTRYIPFLDFVYGRVIESNADDFSERADVPFPTGFPTFSGVQTAIYISDNGVVSFGQPFRHYIPQLLPTVDNSIREGMFVAPFWADADLRQEGRVRYESITNDDTERLRRVNDFIRAERNENYNATWMILVAWENIHPFPHGGLGNESEFSNDELNILNQENTFQCILVTDGVSSYAIFNYKCGSLQWAGGINEEYAVSGYNFRGSPFEQDSRSTRPQISNIACENSPCSEFYTVLYDIGSTTDAVDLALAECQRMAAEDAENFPLLPIPFVDCPCSLFQVFSDQRYQLHRDIFFPETIAVYSLFPSFFGYQSVDCIYSTSEENFGALILTAPQVSTVTLFHPFFSRDDYLQFDLEFRNACCISAGNCNPYTDRRPQANCAQYIPPFFAWMFGDPHITNLDGRLYTFNGLGEYVLTRVDGEIEIQGRTALATPNTTATIFSAFAIRGVPGTEIIEVRVGDENTVAILINGIVSLEAVNQTMMLANFTGQVTRDEQNSAEISLANGFNIRIIQNFGLLTFEIQSPPSFNGRFEGLLGNSDGNSTNDFIHRNGTMTSFDASDREIHQFGVSWQITEEESIFTYEGGDTTETFAMVDHMPVFLDELLASLNESERAEVEEACGQDLSCQFDLLETNNQALAQGSLETNMENLENQAIANNFPPTMNGSATLEAIVGSQTTYYFTVTDDGSNPPMVFVVGNQPADASLTKMDELTYRYTFTIQEPMGFNLSFAANDSFGAASQLDPQMLICGCADPSNCTMQGVLMPSADPLLLECDCSEAYTGRFCEEDVDGCEEISCFPEVQCTDVQAPETGAMCEPCPFGYAGDGQKCLDVNECVVSTPCQQICENTIGSFTCDCESGYSPINETHCENVNECDRRLDDCEQLCMDTIGSFVCDCMNGFLLQPDLRSCLVDPERACPEENRCEQLCALEFNQDNETVEACGCRSGFTLNSDMESCNDVDECAVVEPCDQICNNTVGSFDCSCQSGYMLQSDMVSCQDIDECDQAADEGINLCPNRFCSNTKGSFECICMAGLILVNETCIVPPTPEVTTSVAPPPTSSSVPIVVPTMGPPSQVAEDNSVTVTISSHNTNTFDEQAQLSFRSVTAEVITDFCRDNTDECQSVSDSRRQLSDWVHKRLLRQSILVSANDVIITNLRDANGGLEVTFYVRQMIGVLPAGSVVEAVQAGIDDGSYSNAGFTITSIDTATPAPPASGLSTGAVVGIVIAAIFGAILVFVLITICIVVYIRCTRRKQRGKYDFVTKDTDFTIKNVSYEAPAGEKDTSREGSIRSVRLTFGAEDEQDSSSSDEDQQDDVEPKKNLGDGEETHL